MLCELCLVGDHVWNVLCRSLMCMNCGAMPRFWTDRDGLGLTRVTATTYLHAGGAQVAWIDSLEDERQARGGE